MGENGGPAFPVLDSGQFGTYSRAEGMSLRDYFAAQALGSIPLRAWDDLPTDMSKIQAWANTAYAVADAMLKVRK